MIEGTKKNLKSLINQRHNINAVNTLRLCKKEIERSKRSSVDQNDTKHLRNNNTGFTRRNGFQPILPLEKGGFTHLGSTEMMTYFWNRFETVSV